MPPESPGHYRSEATGESSQNDYGSESLFLYAYSLADNFQSEAPSRILMGKKASPLEFYCKRLLCFTLQNSKDQELVT